MNTNGTAIGLGLFSIGIGLAELVATRSVARPVRMEKHGGLVKSFGVREVATGLGILTRRREERDPWIWARVAGDAIDLAALATSFKAHARNRKKIALAAAAVAAVTALDVFCGVKMRKESAWAPTI